MARAMRSDERQTDLFGFVPPPPTPRAPRPRKPPAELPPPEAETETAAGFAERATETDLDELVSALSDDALAHLALASARQLRRRLGRAGGGRPGAKSKPRPRTPLDRAGAALAAEWASAPNDDAW